MRERVAPLRSECVVLCQAWSSSLSYRKVGGGSRNGTLRIRFRLKTQCLQRGFSESLDFHGCGVPLWLAESNGGQGRLSALSSGYWGCKPCRVMAYVRISEECVLKQGCGEPPVSRARTRPQKVLCGQCAWASPWFATIRNYPQCQLGESWLRRNDSSSSLHVETD